MTGCANISIFIAVPLVAFAFVASIVFSTQGQSVAQCRWAQLVAGFVGMRPQRGQPVAQLPACPNCLYAPVYKICVRCGWHRGTAVGSRGPAQPNSAPSTTVSIPTAGGSAISRNLGPGLSPPGKPVQSEPHPAQRRLLELGSKGSLPNGQLSWLTHGPPPLWIPPVQPLGTLDERLSKGSPSGGAAGAHRASPQDSAQGQALGRFCAGCGVAFTGDVDRFCRKCGAARRGA
jgi:hypothetical protein